jgi:hypothetical protein
MSVSADRRYESQIRSAKGGQTKAKKKFFPIQPPLGLGASAFGGNNFKPPTGNYGDGSLLRRPSPVIPTGVESDQNSAFVRGLSGGDSVVGVDNTVGFDFTRTKSNRDFEDAIPGEFDMGDSFDPRKAEGAAPKVVYDPEKKAFVVVDEGTELADKEDLSLGDIYGADKDGEKDGEAGEVVIPGSLSVQASDALSAAATLGEGIDHKSLRNWLLTFTGNNIVVSRLEEQGDGRYEAFEMVDGVESSLGIFDASIDIQDRFAADNAAKRIQIEQDRLALDDEIQRDQLRIQEELGRIDQDIARDRIRHEQEVASGNWQNALDVQDRIDERERAGRQLDRDLFNAGQELQNRKFELERASFDLDKLEFFQQLSSSPANFADLFNISRGLAPTGAGGPMPQGVARIGQSNVQQTAAQDFRMNGINMAPNINTGALPTLGAEQAVPQFNPAQTQLSFMNGQDPTPVDATGQPVAPAAAPAPYVKEGAGIAQGQSPAPLDFNATTDESGANISAPVNAPVNGLQVDGLQTISNPSVAPVAQTAEEVVQGAPLPPGIEMAFRNALVGAPQTAQESIPLLSPQVLNSLTPAEQEVYFGLAQMQGQYLPDFENLLASRGGSQQVQDSQRVFA